MIYMGIDLGYASETTVVIVRTNDEKNRFQFFSFKAQTEMDELIHKIYELANKYKIPGDHINSPHHPAVEEQLRKRLPTLAQMRKNSIIMEKEEKEADLSKK